MKIKRVINGNKYEFELSPLEMSVAYHEQKRKYDREDVKQIIQRMIDDGYLQDGNYENKLNDIVGRKNHIECKCGDEWVYITEEAIKCVLKDNLIK